MTRTICIGRPSAEQKRVYSAVLSAHLAARQVLADGLVAADAYDVALTALDAEGLGKNFLHSLGHGVGIEVHELPVLGPKSTQPLLAGNVVTVEPGVYLPNFGGVRIEDCGVITTTKTPTPNEPNAALPDFRSFATSPLELLVV